MSHNPAWQVRMRLHDAQEGLCGICWLPLQDPAQGSPHNPVHDSVDTDHILPQVWHAKLGKPGKNRADNLQAVHVECNRMKGPYPSLWHRHTLQMCLTQIRDGTPNTESVLRKLSGPEPVFRARTLQRAERIHFRSAYGLIVPYICKFFDNQKLRVPANARTDQFLQPFLEWVNTEPMRTQHHVERAGMHAEASEMRNRAAKHACRVPQSGKKYDTRPLRDEPADGLAAMFQKLLDDEAVSGGVMAYGTPAYGRRSATQPNQTQQRSRRLALAVPATQPRTVKQMQQAETDGWLTVQIVAHSCDTRKVML